MDSRYITPVDRFFQEFTAPGVYRYTLNGAAPSHQINVSANAGTASIEVNVDDNLNPDPPQLNIDTGDTVCWYTSNPRTAPFFVKIFGQDGGGNWTVLRYDSQALTGNQAFSHAFGAIEEMRWGAAPGSAANGRVIVRAAPPEIKYAQFVINGDVVAPAPVPPYPSTAEVSQGGQVFFAVVQANGIYVSRR